MASFRHLWSLTLGHPGYKEPFRGVFRVCWAEDAITLWGWVEDEDVVGGPGESWGERWRVSPDGERLEVTRDPDDPNDPLDPSVTWAGREVRVGEQVFRGHTLAVKAAALSPDGRFLASTGDDKTLRIWEVATGRPWLRLSARAVDRPGQLAWSPDGSAIAVACWAPTGRYQYTLRAYALKLDAPDRRPEVPGVLVLQVPPSEENNRHAIALPGGLLTSHEALLVHRDPEGRPRWEQTLTEAATSLCASPDGQRVFVGMGRRILLLAADTGTVLSRKKIPGGARWCRDIGWTADGGLVGAYHSGRDEHPVTVHHGHSGKRLWTATPDNLLGVGWTGELLAVSTYHHIELRQGRTGQVLAKLPNQYAAAVGAPGRGLLIANADRIGVYEQTGAPRWEAERTWTGQPISRWSPDGRFLACRVGAHGVEIRDGGQGAVLGTGQCDDDVLDIAWCEDGERFATASDDQSIRLWSPAGVCLAEVEAPAGIDGITLRGDLLVACLRADMVLLWRLLDLAG